MIRKRTARDIPARYQVEIRREELDEMERLRILGGLGSKKELLNNALTLLKWAVRQKQQGYSIASIDENGEVYRELDMPYLESVGLNSGRHLRMVHPDMIDVSHNVPPLDEPIDEPETFGVAASR